MKKSLLFFITIALFFFIWLYSPIPETQNNTQWIFYDRNGEVLFSEKAYFQENKKIPDFFKKGLIAIEDQDFYSHSGLDFSALIRATKQDIESQKIVSGASTITMQLARIIFFPETKRNWWYKFRQIFYAFRIETKWTKEEILEKYIEKINFGTGATGIHAASNRYFSKTPATLSIGESATLIGLIPNPAKFNPLLHPKSAETRKKLVLDIWNKHQIISKEEADYWKNQPIKLNIKTDRKIHAPHFVFWVKNKISPCLKGDLEGAKEIHIYTTLDQKIYSKILNIAQTEILEHKEKNNAHNASVIAIDLQKNEILAMMGSINFFDKNIDGAVNMATARRSTGSTLKPFLYALALENGFSPADELVDELDSFPSRKGRYMPRNFDINQENGRVRYREALANSYNLAAVHLLQTIGLKNFIEKLNQIRLDIGEAEDLGLGAILGSGEESLLNLTTAYTTFPNNGEFKNPKFITKIIIDGTEKNFLPWIGEARRGRNNENKILSQSTSDWITHALSDESIRWKNFSRGNALEVNRPAAIKTGTSQEFRDNWVIGYSPNIALGVWVGNARGAPLHTSSGIEGAGPLWNKIFRLLHKNIPENKFTYVSDRKETQICRRPYEQDNCSEKIIEFLLPAEIQENEIQILEAPQFSMAFPHHGDIFHPKSEILLKVRNAPDKEVTYFLDEKPTNKYIQSLSPGSHHIYAKSMGIKTPSIAFFVEEASSSTYHPQD